MKLIIAIVPDTDSDTVSTALTGENFRVTQIASTGGFLRRGHTTFLIGLEDDQLDQALQIIRTSRTSQPDPNQKQGVVFVLKVDHFMRF
ncbi:MAG: hypothetical protein GYA17_00525 [Chloroflexi bacterium]|jgi:uncharacterized protein YaaQ|nr:hypothetical protein [Chloroflexota bacterium]